MLVHHNCRSPSWRASKVNGFLSSIVSWLRAGYPEGIPPTDTFAVLALLTRRLSNDEVKIVAHELMQRDDFDDVDIGVLINKLTDELPSEEDIERVRSRLAAKGWPLDDERLPGDKPETRHSRPACARRPAGLRRRGALPVLERVLDGRDHALVACRPTAMTEAMLRALRVGSDIDDDVALVVTTSGTTGTPKGAMLTADALTASASATHRRLGGPGSWLLALPPYHIAGLQVLVRSALAGSVPVELDVSAGFDVAELPSAVSRLGSGRRYTSLVAAQLAKALADPAASAALAELDAVLLGGGPAPRPILDAAAAAGIAVVRTYGMSETAGGCVYDGVPLDGVQLRVLSDGRIAIGGATLAKGYRNPVAPDPFAEPGWFHTDDLGAIDFGRADRAGPRRRRDQHRRVDRAAPARRGRAVHRPGRQ